MKINIPKIIRPIALSDYADEMGDAVIYVWVNPSRELRIKYDVEREEIDELLTEIKELSEQEKKEEQIKLVYDSIAKCNDRLFGWWSEILSQHDDKDTHWTIEEIKQIVDMDTDPGFWHWLQSQAFDLIESHRSANKKK